MALALPLETDVDDDTSLDITANLESLQFESGLSEIEKRYLNIRTRSHALTVYACAQATYFVSILNEARHIVSFMKQEKRRASLKILNDSKFLNALKIGIIGCGRIGSQLASCLLSFGEVSPAELKIATRRPETLSDLEKRGVYCTDQCEEVASSSHLIFLCILPNQLPLVAESIRNKISPHCYIYSLVSATPAKKVQTILNHDLIIHPIYEFHNHTEDISDWNVAKDVLGSFSNMRMLTQTCPTPAGEVGVIKSSEKIMEVFIYSLINMCTQLGVNRNQTVDILNAVVLGNDGKTQVNELITENNIIRAAAINMDETNFPIFNLLDVATRPAVPVTKFLRKSHVQSSIKNRYCLIFDQYLDWKKQLIKQNSNDPAKKFALTFA
ncbi:DgyrCDS6192 [Dimorphilus gyrociliatus]|uniref:DgyrCDS6192 n=1 Tax=Dimorphilus gyrociliatus TaxID=2664684 RepID=A0A7I8VNZ7_9ANNE|nr:DgyrCDS6192 [Dimorphilus gyrociliatus]